MMDSDQDNQDESLARKVIGGAIYTGAFIMLWVLFDFKLAMGTALMVWGAAIFNSR